MLWWGLLSSCLARQPEELRRLDVGLQLGQVGKPFPPVIVRHRDQVLALGLGDSSDSGAVKHGVHSGQGDVRGHR